MSALHPTAAKERTSQIVSLVPIAEINAAASLNCAFQEKVQFFEKADHAGILLKLDVIFTWQCHEPGAGYSRCHFTAQLDRNPTVVANVHDKRRRLHLRQ